MAEYRFDDIAINSTEKKKPVESDKEHYLGLEHLDSGTFKVSRFGSEVAPIGDKLIMKKGDVLFGKRRAYQKKVAIAPFDGIFSAHGMVLRPKENVIDKDFFPLFIASDYFLDAAIKISVGSLSPTINWRDLKELKFNLPELDEQKKLAEVLWQIVATIESYKKLLAKTDEMVKAKFVEMFGDPVTNSQKREQVPFKKFIKEIKYGVSLPPAFTENGEYYFLRATNIKKGRIVNNGILKINSEEATKISKCKLFGNEIIIVRSGANTGDTCVVTSEYAGHYAGYDIIITLDLTKSNPVFFNELLNTHYMELVVKPLTKRSAQPHINVQQVSELPMIVADIGTQNKFAEFVKKSEESKSAIQASLDSLTKVYKKIIAENLGGR